MIGVTKAQRGAYLRSQCCKSGDKDFNTDLLAVNKMFFPTYCLSHALKVAFLNDPSPRKAGLLLLRQRLTVPGGP